MIVGEGLQSSLYWMFGKYEPLESLSCFCSQYWRRIECLASARTHKESKHLLESLDLLSRELLGLGTAWTLRRRLCKV